MANTTLNPSDKSAAVALSGGNLIATFSSVGAQAVRSVDKQISGKFYWECQFTTIVGTGAVGIANGLAAITGIGSNQVQSAGAAYFNAAGQVFIDGTNTGAGFGVQSNGAVICIALDLSGRLIWFRVGAAGNWNNTAGANPATGVGGYSIASMGGGAYPAYALVSGSNAGSSVTTANFGGSAFTGAVPAGFTSGFTAGAVIPVNELATQIAAEHWAQAIPPPMQATQVALEHWVTTNVTNPQMAATLVALEHWASVAVASTTSQARAAILA